MSDIWNEYKVLEQAYRAKQAEKLRLSSQPNYKSSPEWQAFLQKNDFYTYSPKTPCKDCKQPIIWDKQHTKPIEVRQFGDPIRYHKCDVYIRRKRAEQQQQRLNQQQRLDNWNDLQRTRIKPRSTDGHK